MNRGVSRFRLILSAIIAVFLFGSMVSCEKKLENMQPAAITDIILQEVSFVQMVKLNKEQLDVHYDFPEGILEDFSCYISESADNTDEVGVFRLSSKDQTDEAMRAISQHLSNRSGGIKDSNANQFDKLQSAVIRWSGTSIILVVCDQNQKVAGKLDELGATVIP